MANGKIFGADGKVVSNNQLNPMKMGIEDLIELQEKSKGRGTGLREADLLTVIIFELSRTKQFALMLAQNNDELEKRIKQLESTNGLAESSEKNQQRTNDRAGATAQGD